MLDVALASTGAQVVLATSSDENFPPENIIDGSGSTFWLTTGLFPQEFIISFTNLMNINNIRLLTTNVEGLTIERSVQNEPVNFEPLTEKVLEFVEGELQSEDIQVDATTAHHLRFVIKSGFDHFISIHRVNVNGSAVH
ncbi:intraflagellar transport protein 25 homolog [Branchiostoma lanceolatum]|uniref:Intraflagellar transport protein 25 homolog n=1 Tax=Branchiostoma lanceolatum TaxID=7740 RepID=A0A8J9YXU8_BRALA|nr:HSPB11 [Branchiostoma lanceolatum]